MKAVSQTTRLCVDGSTALAPGRRREITAFTTLAKPNSSCNPDSLQLCDTQSTLGGKVVCSIPAFLSGSALLLCSSPLSLSLFRRRRKELLPAVRLVLVPRPVPFLARGQTGSIGRGNTGNIPGNNYPNSPSTTIQRPIFLSGKVMFDDGSKPTMDIRIERVCSGSPHLEGHTDSKGRFSFQVGQNQGLDMDAADSSPGGIFGRPGGMGSTSGMGSNSGMGTRGGLGGASAMWGCELRASYPGYRSDVVELGTRHSMDDPEVGTIILHRLTNVQGTTISLTSALAPKGAQKSYEKGMQLAAKSKFEEAEKRLSEATQLYPKYAAAWYALGQLEQQQGKRRGCPEGLPGCY